MANVDGDADADGDDRVVTLYGLERETYPENATFCMSALALGADGVVYAADACAGVMVTLTPERRQGFPESSAA